MTRRVANSSVAEGAVCPSCRSRMPPDFRYCGMCGSRLAGSGVEAEPTEQRRRAAILFADLSGSTAMADRLADEASYAIVRSCLEGLCRTVEDAGGFVVKMLGDGLMALFGAPVAHLDDPERAATAALAMQEWMSAQARHTLEQFGVALRLRVGINFGSVVAAPFTIGDRVSYDVLGDAVNVAQRLEAAAEPGTVCVSEAFYRLTRSEFAFSDRGSVLVKGKSEPIRLFELVRRKTGTAGARSVFPLAGREGELSLIRQTIGELRVGTPGLIEISGESGLGKSRLLDEVAEALDGGGVPYLRGTGDAARQDVPFHLWRSWMAEIVPGCEQSVEALTEQIRGLVATGSAEDALWLATLLRAPERLEALDGASRLQVVRNAIRCFHAVWAGERPAALLLDEAPLVDRSSFQLLTELARPGATRHPVLVILAGREATAGLNPRQTLRLQGLSAAEVSIWAASVWPDAGPETDLVERLVEMTGGSPLYLERLFANALESGGPADLLQAAPDSLFHLLQSEIDVLPEEARRAARLGSALGRSFPEGRLARMMGLDPDASPRPWDLLELRHLLVEHRPPPRRELVFRHGALPDMLYSNMLGDERRRAHSVAAEVLEQEAEAHEDLAAVVARHWEAAGVLSRGVIWSLRAAEQAAAIHAGPEAEAMYRQAARQAEAAGDRFGLSRARAGLGRIQAHRGEFTDAENTLTAALESLPEPDREDADVARIRADILISRGRIRSQTGAPEAAYNDLELAAELVSPGDTLLLRCLVEQAHCLCDLVDATRGESVAAQALSLAEAEQMLKEAAAAGSALGRAATMRGDWSRAEGCLTLASERATGIGDWQTAASCLLNLGAGLKSAGRLEEAAEAIERASRMAQQIGDAEKLAIGRLNLGTVQLTRGIWPKAEEDFRTALHAFRSMSHPLGVAAALYNLGETERLGGAIQDSIAHFDELDGLLGQVQSPHLRVHLDLSRAEVHLTGGDSLRAEAGARSALGSAEELTYPSGVALAQLTLGRALRKQGRLPEARQALEAARQGFDSADERLERARALAELAAVSTQLEDRVRAAQLWADATEIIHGLGAQGWLAHLPA